MTTEYSLQIAKKLILWKQTRRLTYCNNWINSVLRLKNRGGDKNKQWNINRNRLVKLAIKVRSKIL